MRRARRGCVCPRCWGLQGPGGIAPPLYASVSGSALSEAVLAASGAMFCFCCRFIEKREKEEKERIERDKEVCLESRVRPVARGCAAAGAETRLRGRGQEGVRDRGTQERQQTGEEQYRHTERGSHTKRDKGEHSRQGGGAQQGRRGNQNSGDREPEWRGWESVCMGGGDSKGDGLASQPRRYRVPGQPLLNRHQVRGVSCSPDGLLAQQEREPIRGTPAVRGKRTYGGRPGQRVEKQGTWASRTHKHSEAGYGRPVDRGVWTAKTFKRPRQQPAHPQYANYWAPLTRQRHTMPHSAQPQHTNYWAPRTRKRHQQEHRPQRPTESSDPTQHAKGRPGDRPGPRKETTTRRNVTWGGGGGGGSRLKRGPRGRRHGLPRTTSLSRGGRWPGHVRENAPSRYMISASQGVLWPVYVPPPPPPPLHPQTHGGGGKGLAHRDPFAERSGGSGKWARTPQRPMPKLCAVGAGNLSSAFGSARTLVAAPTLHPKGSCTEISICFRRRTPVPPSHNRICNRQ